MAAGDICCRRLSAAVSITRLLEEQRAKDPAGHGSHGGADEGPHQTGVIAVAAVTFNGRAEKASREEAARCAERAAKYPSRH